MVRLFDELWIAWSCPSSQEAVSSTLEWPKIEKLWRKNYMGMEKHNYYWAGSGTIKKLYGLYTLFWHHLDRYGRCHVLIFASLSVAIKTVLSSFGGGVLFVFTTFILGQIADTESLFGWWFFQVFHVMLGTQSLFCKIGATRVVAQFQGHYRLNLSSKTIHPPPTISACSRNQVILGDTGSSEALTIQG